MSQQFSKDNETHLVTIDMRKGHGEIHLGDTEDHSKADVRIKMSGQTFDRLSNKEISGFRAFTQGLLGIKGNLGVL